LINAVNRILITNSGQTILNSLLVTHPGKRRREEKGREGKERKGKKKVKKEKEKEKKLICYAYLI
jgi:hypothetical protein